MKKLNLLGETFGRLTVIAEAPSYGSPSGRKRTKWKVKCSCGTTKEVLTEDLKNGSTISCGCYSREQASKRAKHGHNTKKEGPSLSYQSWSAMKRRCYAPNATKYPQYGAKGITVCDRWLDKDTGFQNFLEDMGERPPGTTLDRYPNRNGNYEPCNCRWGTPKQQSRNRDDVLTPNQVRYIKQQLATGRTQKDIGDELGSHHSTISRIATGKTWADVA